MVWASFSIRPAAAARSRRVDFGLAAALATVKLLFRSDVVARPLPSRGGRQNASIVRENAEQGAPRNESVRRRRHGALNRIAGGAISPGKSICTIGKMGSDLEPGEFVGVGGIVTIQAWSIPMSVRPDAKSQVREVLDRLPDDCTIEDVQYHLYVVQKLRRRIEQADAGHAVSHDEAEKQLGKWAGK